MVVVTALLAVGATACGRKSGNVAVRSQGRSSTSVQLDRASAERVLVTAADLPGFVAGTAPTATDAAATDQSTRNAASSFESCAGTTTLTDGQRVAISPAYFKGNTVAVTSLAVVAPTQKQAQVAMTDLSQADVASCITKLYSDVFGLTAIPGTTTSTEVLATSGVPDESVTWRTTIQVNAGTIIGSAYADLTFLRHDRTVATLLAVQFGQPFPADDRTQILRSMASRAQA